MINKIPKNIVISDEIRGILEECNNLTIATSVEDLYTTILDSIGTDGWHNVEYDVPGKGMVNEARVCKVKNGICANYIEPYMRRRDPDAMVIGDNLPTDKPNYKEVFGDDFAGTRAETIAWLKEQDLTTFFFYSGGKIAGYPTIVIAPTNAAFFAFGLAELQGIIDLNEVSDETFEVKAALFVAPPFRHTHFDGTQVVVHNRSKTFHEIFSYNLYPGPSAKKGIYSVLLHFGEAEGWVTAHASSVRVTTPYGNRCVIMHEGASGSGKSEMLDHIPRNNDGSITFATNLMTDETKKVVFNLVCELEPGTDDMTLCHPSYQKNDGHLWISDAEEGWFIRTNHIDRYGVDPDTEAATVHAQTPMLFLNIDARPGGTALIWDHIEDEPGKKCPNPRFILPRYLRKNILSKPVPVNIRSFGVRSPICTRENPSYGIIGLMHLLPPALAWLWRLVAPRGYANPSIVETGKGMSSEGVGSYWPFVTGKRIKQANLLLKQFIENDKTLYVLIPNQHIGSWEVGFAPEWINREYLPRRNNVPFRSNEVVEARCSILGYAKKELTVEGQHFGKHFMQVDKQPEVGVEAYDIGAKLLTDFFKQELQVYLNNPDLDPIGKKIIEICMRDGSPKEYDDILGTSLIKDD